MARTIVHKPSSQQRAGRDSQRIPLPETPFHEQPHVHVAIIGTGFSGLGMAIQMERRGYHDFVVLERAADVGGTWRDNTYPGCACDIPSNLYSFSFAPNPDWSHLYPQQPEIQDYLRDCAKRFGIVEHIRWNCELSQAAWNEDEQRWHLTTGQGRLTADILIAGQGPLVEPALPNIPGLESFEGTIFHSARWNHTYDLTNKRVAVIGTGASSIQFVPRIQPEVSQLTLFQRTPAWIMPRGDHEVLPEQKEKFRKRPFSQHLVRSRIYWMNELTVIGFAYWPRLLNLAARIAKDHLRAQVPDPELRAKLTPDYTMGCKRVLVSDDFYPAVSQPNVEVVTDAIREIHPHSVVTSDGKEYEVDAIICGTGFHVTDTSFPGRITGSSGRSLADEWQGGMSAYRGTTVSGFPNFFLLIGPNTGLGHNSMVFMIEAQINYILDCMKTQKRQNLQAVDVLAESQKAFNQKLQGRMRKTVWVSGCDSWYLDANGRSSVLWPGFTFTFWRQMRRFDARHYRLSSRKQVFRPASTTSKISQTST